jgi:hypothetical protein
MRRTLRLSLVLLAAMAPVLKLAPAVAQVIPSPGTTCDSNNTCSTNGSSVLPASVSIFNGTGVQTSVTGTVSGSLTTWGVSPQQPYVVAYQGVGTTNDDYSATVQMPFQFGPNIALTNSATILWNNVQGGGLYTGAIVAQSVGAAGTNDGARNASVLPTAAYDGGIGGTVSITHAGALTITGLEPGTIAASGLVGVSQGGVGGAYDTKDFCCAGGGGGGGLVSITTQSNSSISLNGPWQTTLPAAGIMALSLGGQAATADFAGPGYTVGDGGDGGQITVGHSGSISNNIGGAGIIASSIGGSGFSTSGTATLAGGGGQIAVSLTGGQIGVSGTSSRANIGVFAASSVGRLSADSTEQGGGDVTVTLDTKSKITASGAPTFNIGVLAVSSGSASVLVPFGASGTVAANGTATSGTVTVANGGTIQAAGASALGIAALSVGGAGIVTSTNSGDLSYLGNSSGNASGYDAAGASVIVTNSGSIVTNGASGHGILAASTGGGGILSTDLLPVNSGGSWTSGVILGASTPAGSPAQNAGAVTVTNTGTIATGDSNSGGLVAMGIVAQSIGGGGGSFAGSGAAAFIGGNGGGGGNGGQVTVSNSGGISTANDGALGILAQSVGGGGGNGANAAGVFVAVGGQGGAGGNADQVSITNAATGSIKTAGDFAAGIIAQSIGGGGGNGGYAISAGPFISSAIGGYGGTGGDGGVVLATSLGSIVTGGQHSLGLLAQSVGGGGGNGGSANSYAAGVVFSVNLAIGGSGGTAGDGNTVALNNVNQITTAGPDAIGIVAQSIGGGGGTGGASVARTVSVSVPDAPAFSFTSALGGAGGGGGSGGTVVARNAASVSTSGDGAHAILVQSVGGGGGNGGDSTASTYAVAVDSFQVNVTLALGGSGGNGGSGGTVTFGNGQSLPTGSQVVVPSSVLAGFFTACPGCSSAISTSGDNAAGILVQSIGGGGGNATAGNASNNSPLGNYAGDLYQFSAGLGASGGTGANGGAVTVGLDATTSIVTTGSGAAGLIAQSIGGGGGSSTGNSFGLASAAFQQSNDTYEAEISLGGNGVTGGTGGAVRVTNAASITTNRGDSIGILAQSIGGGGGLAGSSDAAATVSDVNQIENTAKPSQGFNYSAEIAIGGTGGSGGDGGAVTVTNTGAITTSGVRAYGIEAQSVGAGGGNAGSATSNAEGTTSPTFSANVALGGSGGSGGVGGSTSVTSSAAISTGGYNAHGILAQSIGGGGGVGADGSVAATSTLSLGLGANGGAGGSGDGGQVTVTTNTGGTISTKGDDAAGILAQSIGGGGGTGTFGCGNSCLNSAGTLNPAYAGMTASYSFQLGNASASGNGGPVGVTVGDRIVTTGARSMGIVAQSISGSGGLAAAAAQNVSRIDFFQGTNFTSGNTVDVALGSSGGIFTSGAGAWGILAQSVGASGGFAGDSSLNLGVGPQAVYAGIVYSFGGQVGVTVNGNIVTTGANAHGVVAQSVGGGGGFAGGGGQRTTMQGFTSASDIGLVGLGGVVQVTQGSGSSIVTTGLGSVGIFTQSIGAGGSSPSAVTVAGTVIGGTNRGYDYSGGGIGAVGILMLGDSNSISVASTGVVGTVDGVNGVAIATPQSASSLRNDGTITGSIDTAGGTIANGGFLYSGSTLNGTVTNAGTVNVFGTGTIGTTTVTGTFTQSSAGNLVVDVNTQTGQADLLRITGSAVLGGRLTPVPVALLPGSAQVIAATGGITGSLTLPSSLVFAWSGAITGAGNTGYTITASANFTPGGVTLTPSQQSLAGTLAGAWASGDPTFARKFAYLAQIDSPTAYAAVLDAYSPKATQAQGTAMVNNAGTVLGASMSCPVFVDQTVLLGEDNCAWAKVTGQYTTQGAAADVAGYQLSGVTYRLGAQHAVAPNWYLGGSFGMSETWASMDGGSTSSGRTFDGSVSLKHTMGPWLFAGSVALASGSFHTNRVVGLPGIGGQAPVNATLQSDQTFFLAGGRLRAAYEIAFGSAYLRPYADVDLIYTNAPGFQESGQSDFALNVQGVSRTSIALSPMVELGGRIALGEGTTLRPFLAAGVRFLPDNRRYVDASFAASPNAGTFRTYTTLPGAIGSLDVGVQLYRAGGFEARAEYGVRLGSGYVSQTAGARLAYHF